MADASATFKPADVATSSDAASDALSRVAAASSTIATHSAAWLAETKGAAASSAIATHHAQWNTACVILKIYNEASAIASGDGKMYFTVPECITGMNLITVGGHLYTAATSGVVGVQIRNVTSGVDMLSAAKLLEWDATEKDTGTAAAASAAVINTANDGVVTGEEIAIDIDAAASGAKGMEIRLGFRTP